jgi:hypothetical protein
MLVLKLINVNLSFKRSLTIVFIAKNLCFFVRKRFDVFFASDFLTTSMDLIAGMKINEKKSVLIQAKHHSIRPYIIIVYGLNDSEKV